MLQRISLFLVAPTAACVPDTHHPKLDRPLIRHRSPKGQGDGTDASSLPQLNFDRPLMRPLFSVATRSRK